MMLVMFFVGLASGIVLGTGVTVIWCEDDDIKDKIKEVEDGKD